MGAPTGSPVAAFHKRNILVVHSLVAIRCNPAPIGAEKRRFARPPGNVLNTWLNDPPGTGIQMRIRAVSGSVGSVTT